MTTKLLGKAAAGLDSDAEDDVADVDKSPSKPEETKPNKGCKRKATNEESKPNTSTVPSKKPKPEPEPVIVKEEIPTPALKSGGPSPAASTCPVTEDEIRKFLLSSATITTQEIVGQFKSRLRNSDDKKAFTDILKRISHIQKNPSGTEYVVLECK